MKTTTIVHKSIFWKRIRVYILSKILSKQYLANQITRIGASPGSSIKYAWDDWLKSFTGKEYKVVMSFRDWICRKLKSK